MPAQAGGRGKPCKDRRPWRSGAGFTAYGSSARRVNVGIGRPTRHSRAEFQGETDRSRTAAPSNDPQTLLEADGFVSIREVARRSSMSEKTIRNFIRNDALP